MHKRHVVTVCRLISVLVVFAAVAVQLHHSITQHWSVANFFSFFTIQSNLIAAFVFLITGISRARGNPASKFAMWRGAATLYMTVTGVVFALLLSGLDVQTTIPWVNDVLHYIFPAVVFADWFIDSPRKHITYRRAALAWTVYPLAYLAYSLVRGGFVHWYPYPFINADKHGYTSVALTSLVLLVATLGLIWLLVRTAYLAAPASRRR